jgi:phosphoribosyl-AMP cyclohydrolase
MAQRKLESFPELKFDEKGLIPVIIQDYKDKKVLMIAYMNQEAFEKTCKTGKVHFYSRSRKALWFKGETSGNVQEVKEICIDCDRDALLILVRQIGNAACHTGYRSCFYRKKKAGKAAVCEPLIFDPKKVYGKK